ncbi:hypothetical protein [Paenirhodobacter populi]|uniref:Uncharacterized protein n=1 Tax=Paenirhodobacter populi TaxID=2306993 RepID=A0A443J6Z1_9RHOB|nr:hypothetical protein [Sinirhodobacter populi]RWR16362.1 hypothetical protein D2T30_21825 [Sinirhodobacter populi]
MTDLNTQMTPEAMMQAEIERSARDYNDLRDAFDKVVAERNWADHRAKKAERELADLRAQTDALVAAAYDALNECANMWQDECWTGQPDGVAVEVVGFFRPYYGAKLARTVALANKFSPTSDAKAALEARDRAMRNEGRRQSAAKINSVYFWNHKLEVQKAILSLIEKEPEGKGDE